MSIKRGTNEFELWNDVFLLRSKYAGEVNTDEQFKKVLEESAALYDKYKDTDAAIPARWCSMMVREIFNTEWKVKHGGDA